MGNRISLMVQVIDDPRPFLYILPDIDRIFQLLSYLNCIFGPCSKSEKNFFSIGTRGNLNKEAPPLPAKRRKREQGEKIQIGKRKGMITSIPVNRLRKHKISPVSLLGSVGCQKINVRFGQVIILSFLFPESQDNFSEKGSRSKRIDPMHSTHHLLLNCFFNSSKGRTKKMGRPWGQVVV
jgi:hypothetical protein